MKLLQIQADTLLSVIRKRTDCCDSCHDDQERGYAPYGEVFVYLNGGAVVKACCCRVSEAVKKQCADRGIELDGFEVPR